MQRYLQQQRTDVRTRVARQAPIGGSAGKPAPPARGASDGGAEPSGSAPATADAHADAHADARAGGHADARAGGRADAHADAHSDGGRQAVVGYWREHGNLTHVSAPGATLACCWHTLPLAPSLQQ